MSDDLPKVIPVEPTPTEELQAIRLLLEANQALLARVLTVIERVVGELKNNGP